MSTSLPFPPDPGQVPGAGPGKPAGPGNPLVPLTQPLPVTPVGPGTPAGPGAPAYYPVTPLVPGTLPLPVTPLFPGTPAEPRGSGLAQQSWASVVSRSLGSRATPPGLPRTSGLQKQATTMSNTNSPTQLTVNTPQTSQSSEVRGSPPPKELRELESTLEKIQSMLGNSSIDDITRAADQFRSKCRRARHRLTHPHQPLQETQEQSQAQVNAQTTTGNQQAMTPESKALRNIFTKLTQDVKKCFELPKSRETQNATSAAQAMFTMLVDAPMEQLTRTAENLREKCQDKRIQQLQSEPTPQKVLPRASSQKRRRSDPKQSEQDSKIRKITRDVPPRQPPNRPASTSTMSPQAGPSQPTAQAKGRGRPNSIEQPSPPGETGNNEEVENTATIVEDYHPAPAPTEQIMRARSNDRPAESTSESGNNDRVTLWRERFNNCQCPVTLEALLDGLTTAIKSAGIAGKRTPREPNSNLTEGTGGQAPTIAPREQRRRQEPAVNRARYDAKESTRVQRLYRANRKRAVREILNPDNPRCAIDREQITAYFRHEAVQLAPELPPQPPPAAHNNPLSESFTPEEVSKKLKCFSNTAPGPDGITYGSLKKFDPEGEILSALFNAVTRMKVVPSSWKKSTTILIYKKGSKNNLSNWRPIALSNTMGKLYSACVARRISLWAVDHKRIGIHQKGFMHFEGCLEHNYLLQTSIQDARRSKKDLVIAWLDLTDAFGSISHSVIWQALKWHGLAEDTIDTVQRLYQNCSTSILTNSGPTEPITILRGVKQGCPLSPIVFNLTIEPFLAELAKSPTGYHLHNRPLSVLAYADDIALLAKDTTSMTTALKKLSKSTAEAGLSFNADKCASLHIVGKYHTAAPSLFQIQGKVMKHLTKIETYHHLGVPTGFSLQPSSQETVQKMMVDVQALDNSVLAPWQKIDALNTFIIPRLSFALKCDYVEKKILKGLDSLIRRCAKGWMCLPDRASVEPIHMPYKEGGANILPLKTYSDISLVCHAVHLLATKDPSVQATAIEDLKRAVAKRTGRQPDDAILKGYLNSNLEGPLATSANDIRSTWSRLRMASRKLSKTINLQWEVQNGIPRATICDDTPLERKNCEHLLRLANSGIIRERLLQKRDQGKVFEVSTTSSFSNHFLREGKFCRFADWRFIHRARLGVVPLNGCRRFGQGDRRCRRCGNQQETLPHVLNHCMRNSRAMTMRHDAVLQRLKNALDKSRATEVRVNQTVPLSTSSLRPDLFIRWEEEKKIALVDVTIPFENRMEALETARNEKTLKYAGIQQELQAQGYSVFLDAFIIGALGSYDHQNSACLRNLRISPRYWPLMIKLMVSDTIHWSRDIYVEHLTGVRQYKTECEAEANLVDQPQQPDARQQLRVGENTQMPPTRPQREEVTRNDRAPFSNQQQQFRQGRVRVNQNSQAPSSRQTIQRSSSNQGQSTQANETSNQHQRGNPTRPQRAEGGQPMMGEHSRRRNHPINQMKKTPFNFSMD